MIFISESLTRSRYEMLQRAKDVIGNKIACIADGNIFAIVNDTKWRIVKSEDLQLPKN
jgi:hypothetical protein